MTEHTHPSRQALWNDIKNCKFAMFTTRHANGHLHSRPMTLQNEALDADDSLWFFMSKGSDPVAELAAEPSVNVAFSPPGDACWISVTGMARIVEDGDKAKTKAKALWSSSADAWFSGGPTDPDLAVVQVCIVHVSEWSAGADPGSRPSLRSEDVGFRPPNHLPTQTTPTSENVALMFERS
jgi:general stress protein 26